MSDALTTALTGLDPSSAAYARGHLTEAEVQVGEQITHRGDDDPAVAWVLSGEVELRIEGKPVFTVTAGGVVVGEDVYGDLRRTFTAVARRARPAGPGPGGISSGSEARSHRSRLPSSSGPSPQACSPRAGPQGTQARAVLRLWQ